MHTRAYSGRNISKPTIFPDKRLISGDRAMVQLQNIKKLRKSSEQILRKSIKYPKFKNGRFWSYLDGHNFITDSQNNLKFRMKVI